MMESLNSSTRYECSSFFENVWKLCHVHGFSLPTEVKSKLFLLVFCEAWNFRLELWLVCSHSKSKFLRLFTPEKVTSFQGAKNQKVN